ncbi:hypothetical protein SPFM20_00066 [Salmonella phage SPFM20]|nr:hypothetical protein SPFM20_00066 [Salmonella phage SPFM20]
MGIFLQGDAWVLTDDISGYLVKVAEGNSYSDLVMPVVEKPRSLKDRSLCNLYIVDPCEDIVAGDEDNCSQVIWYDRAMFHELITGALNWFLHRFWTELVDCRIWTMEELYDEHVRMLKPKPMPKQVPPQIPPLPTIDREHDVVAELVTETIARYNARCDDGAAPMEDYDVLYKWGFEAACLINCVEQYGWMSWMATNRELKKRCNMLRVVSESLTLHTQRSVKSIMGCGVRITQTVAYCDVITSRCVVLKNTTSVTS